MKKLSMLLASSLLFSSTLFASSSDKVVIDFEKKRLSQNPAVKVVDITVDLKKELPLKGWYGYILDVEAKVQQKSINAKDIVFSNGEYVALELLDAKTGRSLKDLVTPDLTSNYHDKSKLIAGNHNAKDKIVVFSDPLCPFCMDYIPDIIKHVNKNSDSIALYYYHFPLLRIHPAARPLSLIMEVAKEKGIKDIELKVYEADWDKYFDSKETDMKKVLAGFNKEFKTNITLDEINDVKLLTLLNKDIKMGEEVMVQGTPTIYINGVRDNSKQKFLTLGK